ncbi:tail fiber protein [Megamonas funiformis]|uniref:tail fiber protein n=1 Tax=Megamonas funiformis TaxID=437897 RepID=UPI00289EB346|nr:tail fiber protein [Megamonas funiformis]
MNKKRPANMVVSAMLATIIFIIIANCFMNLWGNSFTTLTAAKTATQAQAYSDIVSEKIKLEGTDAEEVTTKTKLSEITGNDSDDDWFYTYEIENETEDDNGNVFKVASIKIYKDDENGPRYSTEIPLSSLENNLLPIGAICQWPNNARIPDDFLECNGNNFDVNKYPKLYKVLNSNKLPNINDSLNVNINGYYAIGVYKDRNVDHGNSSHYWSWGGYEKTKYSFSLGKSSSGTTNYTLYFKPFNEGFKFNWHLKLIIKAK